MNLYNQLEQLVEQEVDRLFDTVDRDRNPGMCTCRRCRLDAACYVLNRASPKYVVSERGFTHMEIEQTPQERADLLALVKEGFERVNSSSRHPHDKGFPQEPTTTAPSEGPWYDFPVITGRLLNGITFEPIVDATVLLSIAGKQATMRNDNWRNPLSIPRQAQGRYSLWPTPVHATRPGTRTHFAIKLSVTSSEYEPFDHHFRIELESTSRDARTPRRSHQVGDLYMFPSQ